jgi:hypothetical protein
VIVKSLINKVKSQSKKETSYYCKVGEKLAIISKPGDFYIVVNVRNEVFTLLSSELQPNDFKNKVVPFNKNRVILFEDYILEEFSL